MSSTSTKLTLKVPHFEQELANSCLPACIRIVLAYYRKDVLEQNIRRIIKTKPAGTNPLNVTYLKSLNIETNVLFSNLGELKHILLSGRKPMIALLWTGELSYWQSMEYIDYLHSVVVIGFDESNIILNDPSFSDYPKIISNAEFLEAWSYSHQMLILIEKP